MDKQERCPRCGCEKNVTGIGFIYASPRFVVNHQVMYHVFCLECGNLIRSYIEHPERLIAKK